MHWIRTSYSRGGLVALGFLFLILGCSSGAKPDAPGDSSNSGTQEGSQLVEQEKGAPDPAAGASLVKGESVGSSEEAPAATLSPALTALLESLSAEERGRTNPLSGNQDEITLGKSEYMSMCFVCHGAQGKGDGPAAKATPSTPSDLSDPVRSQLLSDGDRFAVMRLGIEGTAMPASGANLNDQQVWRILAYVETLVVK
jgi:mono/diheme cytochrome c family protein